MSVEQPTRRFRDLEVALTPHKYEIDDLLTAFRGANKALALALVKARSKEEYAFWRTGNAPQIRTLAPTVDSIGKELVERWKKEGAETPPARPSDGGRP